MMNKKIVFSLFIFLSVCVIAYVSFSKLYAYNEQKKQLEKQLEEKKANWAVLENKIKGKTAEFGQETGLIIKDLSTGWTIAVNENKLFPSASLVKVPIMATVFSLSAEKGLNLGQRLVLANKCKVLGSGIIKKYAAGTEFNIEYLIEVMITESDNTAANMLIDYLGLEPLNNYFKKLGLSNTNIARKMMDFKSRQEGIENFTSASDVSYLLEEIYNNKLINRDFSLKCLGILKKQKARDRIPAKLPSGAVVAHKTGLERGVCHDAGIVFTPNGDFLICVLTRHNYKFAAPAKKFISQVAADAYNYYRLDDS